MPAMVACGITKANDTTELVAARRSDPQHVKGEMVARAGSNRRPGRFNRPALANSLFD